MVRLLRLLTTPTPEFVVIKHFNVIKHITPGCISCSVDLSTSRAHFFTYILSKSQLHDDDVAVAARANVLESGDTSVNPVIYIHTNTGAVYCNGAAGGVAPHDGAVSGGIKVVVEPVAAAVHDALRMGPAARGERHGIPDAARAVHVNITGSIKR